MPVAQAEAEPCDIFVIGGGINGCGIARDAAGRGLSVILAEMGDLASATSSSSTKLFHGGLRYLEFFEFRLVREALRERETLLRAMPHISWPMRFVLPFHRDMRFEATSPLSRVLGTLMPWLGGRRPAWLIRLGLFVYDNLGGRKLLPGTRSIDLSRAPEGKALQGNYRKAFEYSDCWIEDARLVVANARDAEARGASILTRTRVVSAERADGVWQVMAEDADTGTGHVFRARCLVNAGGPWVCEVLRGRIRANAAETVRLVRGSHIVTRRLYDHDKCYFLQGTDGRIVFMIPFEGDFTLIGTTEQDHPDPETPPVCTPEEQAYLVDFVNAYLDTPISVADVVWTYSGVRPLYDDAARSATAATRDYVLKVDDAGGAPLLNVFGGKITTYRRLSETALDRLARFFPRATGAWTAGVALPGGSFPVDGVEDEVQGLCAGFPFLDRAWARRMVRAYGTEARTLFDGAAERSDLGEDFGATLTAREVAWLMDREYARTAEDVVWRRSKLGLRLDEGQVARLDAWMQARRRELPGAARQEMAG
ncbi:glycerol-3-phosphate dehydrogenase [Rhodobacterales bacterium HKCCE2091]|nr:glycerol-3-phosphate dehydrogenase [Rhodobacterales bacterium HKCCE2091]